MRVNFDSERNELARSITSGRAVGSPTFLPLSLIPDPLIPPQTRCGAAGAVPPLPQRRVQGCWE